MTGKTYPKRDPGRCPSHPGAVLREIVLPELRMTKVTIAAALRLSRNQLHMILSEKQPVTPETAVKLEAAFGGSARMWLGYAGGLRSLACAANSGREEHPIDARRVRKVPSLLLGIPPIGARPSLYPLLPLPFGLAALARLRRTPAPFSSSAGMNSTLAFSKCQFRSLHRTADRPECNARSLLSASVCVSPCWTALREASPPGLLSHRLE